VKGTSRPGSYQVTSVRPARQQRRHTGRQINSKDTRSVIRKSQTSVAAWASSRSYASPTEGSTPASISCG
jgi:hypothetical protein